MTISQGRFSVRTISRAGPTGLILTTTRIRIHHENETRILSIPINDSPDQTRAVLRSIASESREKVDFDSWHALQEWIALGERDVTVPFGPILADLVSTAGVRLRRDFRMVMTLIRTHALLHRAMRETDGDGRIVANLDDYAAVHSLIDDLLAEGVGARIKPNVRETVAAVQGLLKEDGPPVLLPEVAAELGLDRNAAWRRVKEAGDHIKNLETRPRQPMLLVLGEPLPKDHHVLPSPEELADAIDCCAVAPVSGDMEGEPSEDKVDYEI